MKTMLFSLAIAAACLAANPALAGDAKLAWNDLDLTTAAGKAELDNRIEAAAERVCTSGPVTGSMIGHRATPRCLADARDAIKAQVTAKLGNSQLGGDLRRRQRRSALIVRAGTAAPHER